MNWLYFMTGAISGFAMTMGGVVIGYYWGKRRWKK